MLAFLGLPLASMAVEGGLGHSVPGLWGGPKIGIIPSEPGLHFVNYLIGYKGSNLVQQMAINGEICKEVRASLLVDYVESTYIPFRQGKGRTFGYGIAIPAAYVNTSVNVLTGDNPGKESGSSFDLGDIIISPLLLGWKHGNCNSALRLLIFAKSGHFELGVVGLTGDNTWTVTPMFAQTYINPDNGWDFSYNAGIDFYTRNHSDDYQNGAVFHLDISTVRELSNDWSFGLIYGWLQQINDDTGPMARELGGFRGHAMGIGPIATYSFKSHGRDVGMGFRVVKEFNVKNRLRGWTALWTTAFKW